MWGEGGGGTWDPWCEPSQLSHGALPGGREAGWIGKGPLSRVLTNLQSLSPDPSRHLQVLIKQEGADQLPTKKTSPPPSASLRSMFSWPRQVKEGVGVGLGG